jgi:hypothetical protein
VRSTSSSTWERTARGCRGRARAAARARASRRGPADPGRGRLVEHDELGRVDELPAELDALAHAGRERPDQPQTLLLEADLEEDTSLVRSTRCDAEARAAHPGGRRDRAPSSSWQALVLGHVADAPPQLEDRAPPHRCPAGARRRCRAARARAAAFMSVDLPAPLAPGSRSRLVASST